MNEDEKKRSETIRNILGTENMIIVYESVLPDNPAKARMEVILSGGAEFVETLPYALKVLGIDIIEQNPEIFNVTTDDESEDEFTEADMAIADPIIEIAALHGIEITYEHFKNPQNLIADENIPDDLKARISAYLASVH